LGSYGCRGVKVDTRGSIRGEVGQTQFMSKNILAYGTGNLDVAANAISSTANILRAHCWRAGAGSWGSLGSCRKYTTETVIPQIAKPPITITPMVIAQICRLVNSNTAASPDSIAPMISSGRRFGYERAKVSAKRPRPMGSGGGANQEFRRSGVKRATWEKPTIGIGVNDLAIVI
jgi:hypothetical protein